MQKQALYRMYRPKTFSEVVGQEHVTNTLKRQIAGSSISHAYLFTGTRGTGKTSCARLFARAISCLCPKDGEPCNECAVCKGALDGNNFDIVEIDAASNNSIDDIRELRDDIAYAPMLSKYKVYIIDEAHMLSAAAFNGLLKTLEEPPEHAVFILATTEPHKIPATILSRCQRYDFYRISVKTITELLNKVISLENKTLDKSSVSLVAELADGSCRDALSILEKVLEMESADKIEHILGVIGRKKLFEAVRSIAASDTDALFSLVAELYSSSKDLTLFIDELTELFRKIITAKTAADPSRIIDASDEDIAEIKSLSGLFGEAFLIYALKTLRETRRMLVKGSDARAETELCLILLAKPSLNEDETALYARLEAVENKVDNIRFSPAPERKPAPKPVLPSEAPAKKEEKQEKSAKQETVAVKEDIPVVEEPPVSEAPSSGEWKELQSLSQIAGRINDMEIRLILKEYAKAVYRGNEVVIIVSGANDAQVLGIGIEKIKAAFEADRKPGRVITVERGDDLTKYISGREAYDNLEVNPMFDIQ